MAAIQNQILNNASILSLRCFVTVVETQSFSSAARQLRIAPSSVTKHVQLIETALKVALVHRTTRRVSVTETGERFYEQCLAILAQIDSATAVVDSENLSGHLRITAPPSFTAATLGPHLHEFMKSHPAISLDVNVTSGTPDLIRNRIDIAIILQDQPQSKLTHFRLATCPLTLCASPDYIAQRGIPKKPEDLLTHECLAGRFSDLAEGWSLRQNGVWRVVNPRFKLLSDNGDLLRLACLGGAGIGGFYDFHIRDDLHSGRLVPVLADYELQARSIFAIVPHRKIVRPQVKAFIDFVQSLLSAPEFVI
jgi:DNA-binding transcriptional LysR family regulator